MNNCEKKLDALIDALGFDVEEVTKNFEMADKSRPEAGATFMLKQVIDYKVTKRNDPQRKYNLYMSALIEYQSGATTLEEFTEITKGLL